MDEERLNRIIKESIDEVLFGRNKSAEVQNVAESWEVICDNKSIWQGDHMPSRTEMNRIWSSVDEDMMKWPALAIKRNGKLVRWDFG